MYNHCVYYVKYNINYHTIHYYVSIKYEYYYYIYGDIRYVTYTD